MKKTLIPVVALALLTESAHATNLAVITTPPAMLNSLVGVFAVVCGIGAIKVMNTVKGGLLARSWKMFLVGFGALFLAQVAWLVETLEIYTVPSFVGPALWTIAVGFLAYGIFETKKALG